MACAAGPAFFLFHMQSVQVDIAISEFGNTLCCLSRYERFYMAEETEAVFTLFIFRVKFMWERQP
jgi:hypothetical protein